MACAKCKTRLYCSTECQAADYHHHGHKHYCCKSGEINHTFELGETDYIRGVGMFALRPIQRGDKIFVERMIDRDRDLTPSIRAALSFLQPKHGNNINDTFQYNCISVKAILTTDAAENSDEDDDDDDDNDGPAPKTARDPDELNYRHTAITLAHVNHDCIGNSSYQYVEEINAVVLVASTNIAPQEEITFPYVDTISDSSQFSRLRQQWGFDCTCRVCSEQTLKETFAEACGLISEIRCLGTNPLVIMKGKRVLQILENLQLPYYLHARICYKMFASAIVSEMTGREAMHCISDAVRYITLYFGDVNFAEVRKYKGYWMSPQSHSNYLTESHK
jgi:hypothetical protein